MSGSASRWGIAAIVRRLAVTSSPVVPSPRVAPWTKRPASYRREMARPSIFSSATYRGGSSSGPSSRWTRASNARSSASSNALPRLSIGARWATSASALLGRPPTERVGESSVTSSGWAASRSWSSRKRWSHSASEMTGAVQLVVGAVGLGDQRAQLGHSRRRFGRHPRIIGRHPAQGCQGCVAADAPPICYRAPRCPSCPDCRCTPAAGRVRGAVGLRLQPDGGPAGRPRGRWPGRCWVRRSRWCSAAW